MFWNRQQKFVMWAAGFVLLGMLLFPPWWWNAVDLFPAFNPALPERHNSGRFYRFILDPPVTPDQSLLFYSGIDYVRWLIPMGAVCCLAAGVVWALRDP
jgi:hypothetical protein